MHSNVHSSIIYNCQVMEATLVSINRWMDKEVIVCLCIYTYTYIYIYIQLLKQKDILTFARTNTDGPGGYYA